MHAAAQEDAERGLRAEGGQLRAVHGAEEPVDHPGVADAAHPVEARGGRGGFQHQSEIAAFQAHIGIHARSESLQRFVVQTVPVVLAARYGQEVVVAVEGEMDGSGNPYGNPQEEQRSR